VNTPTIADRLGAASGAAYVLLINVGNQMASGSGPAHPTGQQDLADFSRSPGLAENIGFTLELLGLLAFMFFLGWFVSSLRRRGGSAEWLAGVAGLAGVVTLAVKLGSAAPILTGEVDHGQLSPTFARVLADMNGSAFVVTFLPYGVFLLASGLAILGSGWLGRVSGWTAVVFGALGIVVPLLTHLDPAGTNPMPFVLGMLWVLVVSVRLAWRGPRTPTVDAPTVEPVAATV
jgi:hypothetical protein